MKAIARKIKGLMMPDRLTEAYEVRAFRDEDDETRTIEAVPMEIAHAEQGALQAVKSTPKGHGEQIVLPDDCQFGDNDLCFVES